MKNQNNDFLRRTVQERNIKRQKLADTLNVSIHTVRAWLLPDTSAGFRVMPQSAYSLLSMKIDAGEI